MWFRCRSFCFFMHKWKVFMPFSSQLIFSVPTVCAIRWSQCDVRVFSLLIDTYNIIRWTSFIFIIIFFRVTLAFTHEQNIDMETQIIIVIIHIIFSGIFIGRETSTPLQITFYVYVFSYIEASKDETFFLFFYFFIYLFIYFLIFFQGY